MRPVIQVSGVHKTYGRTVAVDEVSFEVNNGEIFGLIGPNGAGKTTTVEILEGMRTPDRGGIGRAAVLLGGEPAVEARRDVLGVDLERAVERRLGVMPN